MAGRTGFVPQSGLSAALSQLSVDGFLAEAAIPGVSSYHGGRPQSHVDELSAHRLVNTTKHVAFSKIEKIAKILQKLIQIVNFVNI